ncbi:hypothetical protein F4808DRAFT_20229 [Astrocystis sublimbata]|nr:hypothetical protein F4808DRAFT_20229 [Astrocystis sublimbata]
MAPLELSDFQLENKALVEEKSLPASFSECKDYHEQTAWVMNVLRQSTVHTTRSVLQENRDLIRPLKLKMIQEGENKVQTVFNLQRAERERATALYLFTKGTNKEPCVQCTKRISKGPFECCVADGPTIAKGACFNCSYSGLSKKCSIRRNLEKQREAESDEARPVMPELTDDYLAGASTRELLEWKEGLEAELAIRAAKSREIYRET